MTLVLASRKIYIFTHQAACYWPGDSKVTFWSVFDFVLIVSFYAERQAGYLRLALF